MKRWLVGCIVLFLAVCSGCGFLLHDTHGGDDGFFDHGRDEPDGGVSSSEIISRLHMDVRMERDLKKRAEEGEGDEDPDLMIIKEEEGPWCCEHDVAVTNFDFHPEAGDGPGAVRETVYFCGEGREYWYRWMRMQDRRTRWFGPFPSKLPKRE